MDTRVLQNMYQQWMQGNDDYIYRWYDFVLLVSKHYGSGMDDVMRVLQTCNWFIKGDK